MVNPWGVTWDDLLPKPKPWKDPLSWGLWGPVGCSPLPEDKWPPSALDLFGVARLDDAAKIVGLGMMAATVNRRWTSPLSSLVERDYAVRAAHWGLAWFWAEAQPQPWKRWVPAAHAHHRRLIVAYKGLLNAGAAMPDRSTWHHQTFPEDLRPYDPSNPTSEAPWAADQIERAKREGLYFATLHTFARCPWRSNATSLCPEDQAETWPRSLDWDAEAQLEKFIPDNVGLYRFAESPDGGIPTDV
jgi:hypothetical protein